MAWPLMINLPTEDEGLVFLASGNPPSEFGTEGGSDFCVMVMDPAGDMFLPDMLHQIKQPDWHLEVKRIDSTSGNRQRDQYRHHTFQS
jgi:hypothetical protein